MGSSSEEIDEVLEGVNSIPVRYSREPYSVQPYVVFWCCVWIWCWVWVWVLSPPIRTLAGENPPHPLMLYVKLVVNSPSGVVEAGNVPNDV